VAGAGRLAAVPAGSGGGGWVVIAEPVRYREQRILFTYGYDDVSLFIASRDRPGLAGTLIVGLDLSDVDRIIGRFALACLALGGVATVAVAFLSGMGLRALLRPRRSGTSAQSEAAARSSSERLSRSIMDTGHKLQGPLSVVRGSAEYYRQRDGLSPAELDRMMWRVGAETTRLDALIDDLLSTGHDQPHPP
jgi:signal transduction histidine kinase